jgi:hypothetical protein
VQGVGDKWIFSSASRSFGYGYEAVRIRVKNKQMVGSKVAMWLRLLAVFLSLPKLEFTIALIY